MRERCTPGKFVFVGEKKKGREKDEEFCLFRWRGDAKQQRWSQGALLVQCGTAGLPCSWGRVICRGSCPALLLALGAGSGSPLQTVPLSAVCMATRQGLW